MRLRGIDFGNVFVSGWPLDHFGGYLHPILDVYKKIFKEKFSFSGTTIITRPVTIKPRLGNGSGGNMLIDAETTKMAKWVQDCFLVNPLRNDMLIADGYSNPGFENLLKRKEWRRLRPSKLFISYVPVCDSHEARLGETREFACLLKKNIKNFYPIIGIQLDTSFLAGKEKTSEYGSELVGHLEILNKLNEYFDALLVNEAEDSGVDRADKDSWGYHDYYDETDLGFRQLRVRHNVPICLKVGVASSVTDVSEVIRRGYVDVIEVASGVPFGSFPDRIDWIRKYGRRSPLQKYGGGFYYGPENFSLAIDWIDKLRNQRGQGLPVICGEVCSRDDIDLASGMDCLADGISISRLAVTRPWLLKDIVLYGNEVLGKFDATLVDNY